jgi:predicted small secreted protein
LSSTTNGSQGLKKKISIRILTIALFAIGGLIAAVAIYQQYPLESQPYSISKEEAIRIALAEVDKEPNRDIALLPNEKGEAKLVHVTDDGLGFFVDEKSLGDWLAFTSRDERFLPMYENQYFWYVFVTTSTNEGENRGYSYLIGSQTGQVIGSDNSPPYIYTP